MKRLLISLLVLVLCAALLPAAVAEWNGNTFYALGDVIPDFTLTTAQGETWTLSEQLAGHKAVLLNFWFANCGPCRYEFPYLAEAYTQHKDEVAVLAITPYDSEERIRAYQAELSLPFAMAADTIGITNSFVDYGFPTSVLIDRNGVMCFSECGSQPSTDVFLRLFAPYLADDYDAPLLLEQIPQPAPDPMPEAETLDSALNVTGGTLRFGAKEDMANAWPWLPTADGSALRSANTGIDDSAAVISTTLQAQAGDALVFRFQLSSEPIYDVFQVWVNGQVKKQFSGERAWQSYALPFAEAGAYTVDFVYLKDTMEAAGADSVQLDDVALLHGADAQAAIAANPQYPLTLQGNEARIRFLNEGTQEIVFDDPQGIIKESTGATLFYIVPGEPAQALIELGDAVDPDAAVIVTNYDNAVRIATDCSTNDSGFVLTTGTDTSATTGYPWSAIAVYPVANHFDTATVAFYFASAEEVDAFCQTQIIDPVTGNLVSNITWSYAAPSASDTDAAQPQAAEEASYVLLFLDQTGAPVPGVIANICDEDTCMPMVADANGQVAFTAKPTAYDIHVIKIPDGYSFDLSQDYQAPANGGEMRFELTRE